MTKNSLKDRGKALEESFFQKRDKQLLSALRAQMEATEKKDALARISGVTDDAVLEQLIANGIESATVAALALFPLVAVAWADDTVQSEEREAILAAAADDGLDPGDTSYQLLQNWLEEKPSDELLATWKDYVRSLCQTLDTQQRDGLKTLVLGRAMRVAQAAGGILGLGNKVSRAESAVLADLDSTFG